MIALKGLWGRWGGFTLKDINLELSQSEYFILLGPSGAGKTLLLETIAGLRTPIKGEIWINGGEVSRLPPEKRGVGFVPQNYALFPHMTATENVMFGLEARGVPRAEKVERTRGAMELTRTLGLADKRPDLLSGGEKQRVALARALAINPKVLLLDEPLSALDVGLREEVRREIKRIQEEAGITTFHVTHDQNEAWMLADRVGVMMEGRLLQAGSVEEVFNRPEKVEVAKFVEFENLFPGKARVEEEGLLLVDLWDGVTVEALSERVGTVTIGIRPEDIIVSKEPIRGSPRNHWLGQVAGASDLGPLVKVKVDVEGRRVVALITRRSFREMGLGVGSPVYLTFKATSVHVI